MKKIILVIAALALIGCKKEEPNKIEVSFEGNERIEAIRLEINNEVKFEKLPYKYVTNSSLIKMKIRMCCLDKWRPSTIKVQIHDNNKQVYIHDIISEFGSIEYEYSYERQ